jgi:hypothetical protein
MIGQNGIINRESNPRPLKYPALVAAMQNVARTASDLTDLTDGTKVEIHAPKFGSGLAGGNWNFICDLITDIWLDTLNVYIYTK